MSPSESTFKAAVGWFELGNFMEAFTELENLPPEHRASVEVMELRCRMYRKLEKWQELEWVAEGCLGSGIENIPFACHHAWALLKQGNPKKAHAALKSVPYECAPELLFTHACVECALGNLDAARTFIADAITFSLDSKAMKLRALDEPELENAWK